MLNQRQHRPTELTCYSTKINVAFRATLFKSSNFLLQNNRASAQRETDPEASPQAFSVSRCLSPQLPLKSSLDNGPSHIHSGSHRIHSKAPLHLLQPGPVLERQLYEQFLLKGTAIPLGCMVTLCLGNCFIRAKQKRRRGVPE